MAEPGNFDQGSCQVQMIQIYDIKEKKNVNLGWAYSRNKNKKQTKYINPLVAAASKVSTLYTAMLHSTQFAALRHILFSWPDAVWLYH